MQLQKIKAALAAYEDWLVSKVNATKENLYKWESQRIWQEHWDLEEIDVAGMFNKSLENTTTRRIWSREYYTPKKNDAGFCSNATSFCSGNISRFI